jgi:hypothetical protein
MDKNTKLCSFDIENMYTNIPTMELKDIIETSGTTIITRSKKRKRNYYILDINLEQNYLQFNNQFFKQNEGLTRQQS